MWARLFSGPVDTLPALVALVATLLVAAIAARFARRLSLAALRAMLHDTVATSSPHVAGPLRLVSAAIFFCVAAVVLFPAFEVAGLRPRTGVHLRTVAEWVFAPGLRITLIVVLAYALVRATALVVRRFEHEISLGTGLDALERAKRARTLGSVVKNITTALVVAIAILMILLEFRLDITPVLTGAGIVGLAVGFGAQTLVRDIITGFFLILENQIRVGDVAVINGTAGLVEAINLRTVVLRDLEGTVHVFPNGSITTLANRTKDFSYYVITLAVSYFTDVDQVAELVRATGADLQADPAYTSAILEPIEVLGVDDFTEWAVQVKIRIKTVPLKQFDVGRELRRRLLKGMRARGFVVPFPVPATAVPPAVPSHDQEPEPAQ